MAKIKLHLQEYGRLSEPQSKIPKVLKGEDGFSPIATVEKEGKVATITITDKNGTTTAEIYDGEGGGGGGGTTDYTDLTNKPKINNVTLSGSKSAADLGLATPLDIPDVSGFYTKPSSGIPASDLASGVIPDVSGFYEKPSGGIPKTDLASGVQVSLNKADTALQSYTETDPTVPNWAKQPTKPSYTASEIGALPDDTVIPSKTSDLTNDSGFISTETDPTVPSWAKQPTKPTYTASEVGALPDSTAIPVIDDTLTETGEAADAKAVGDEIAVISGSLSDLSDEFADLKVNQGFVKNTVFQLSFVQGNISDSKGTNSGSSHVIRTDAYYDVSDTDTLHVTFDRLEYPALLFCTFLYAPDGTFLSVDYKHQGSYDINVSSAGTVRFKVQREDSSTVISPSDGVNMVDAGYSTYLILASEDYVDTSLETAKAYTDSKTGLQEIIKTVWQTGKISDSGQDSGSSNTSYIRNTYTFQPPKAKVNYAIPTGINVDAYIYSGSDLSTFNRKSTGLSGSGSLTITLGEYLRLVANYSNSAAIDPAVGDTIIISYDADIPEIAADIDANRIASYVSFSMFSDIGVCGDSFASGGIYPSGTGITDYDISWPQVLARKCGITAYNYAVGGISTKDWLANSSRGLTKLLSDPAKKMYILNFGINDNTQINAGTFTLGTVDDIKSDYTQNPESFFGCYGRIIGNIQTHAPGAPIILLSVARPTERNMDASIQAIAEKCGLPYIQLTDDPYFDSGYFMGSFKNNHPLAYGYSGMASAIERLICRYIAEHPTYFKTYQ